MGMPEDEDCLEAQVQMLSDDAQEASASFELGEKLYRDGEEIHRARTASIKEAEAEALSLPRCIAFRRDRDSGFTFFMASKSGQAFENGFNRQDWYDLVSEPARQASFCVLHDGRVVVACETCQQWAKAMDMWATDNEALPCPLVRPAVDDATWRRLGPHAKRPKM